MKAWLATSALMISAATSGSASPFDGLCGKELFLSVRANYAVANFPTSGNIWEYLSQIEDAGDGTLKNIFSEEQILKNNGIAPANVGLFYVVDPIYWGKSALPLNLSNIFIAPLSETERRQDYPPIFCPINNSQITVKYQNNLWGIGIYALAPGYEINCYFPPKGYEGDFARIVMMMATLYPAESWNGKGNNIFIDNSFPVFQTYYLRDLLYMHEADPVDERELARNNAIAKIQGKGNPFVEFPLLASHIWGSEKEKPYQGSTAECRRPLKARYTAEDNYFYCYSPYLPGEVEWFSFNNKRYSGNTAVSLSEVVAGTYTVFYKGADFSGSVVIEVLK